MPSPGADPRQRVQLQLPRAVVCDIEIALSEGAEMMMTRSDLLEVRESGQSIGRDETLRRSLQQGAQERNSPYLLVNVSGVPNPLQTEVAKALELGVRESWPVLDINVNFKK